MPGLSPVAPAASRPSSRTGGPRSGLDRLGVAQQDAGPQRGRDHFPNAWATVLAGGGINGGQDHKPLGPLPVVYVSDLEAAHARVIDAGGIVTRAIFSFPGGRRFHFADPAGNELAVWSDKP